MVEDQITSQQAARRDLFSRIQISTHTQNERMNTEVDLSLECERRLPDGAAHILAGATRLVSAANLAHLCNMAARAAVCFQPFSCSEATMLTINSFFQPLPQTTAEGLPHPL